MLHMRPLGYLVLMLVAASLACYKLESPDDVANKNPWKVVPDYQSERAIRNTFATPFELFIITDNEFARFDPSFKLIEKIKLNAERLIFGRPALNDNLFARVTQQEDNQQVLEFYLTKAPGIVRRFDMEDLAGASRDIITVDHLARTVGAFNTEGTLFLVPTLNASRRHYTFFLIKLQLNQTANDFVSATVFKRIDVAAIPVEDNNVTNIRYFDNYFFVTSKKGLFRISLNGEVQQVLQNWMIDVFKWNRDLYATGFDDANFFFSNNGGLRWEKGGITSELKHTVTVGDFIFSQEIPGRRFQIATANLSKVQDIVYNEDFTEDPTSYVNIVSYGGRYVVAIDKEIVYTQDIEPVDK